MFIIIAQITIKIYTNMHNERNIYGKMCVRITTISI